MHAGLCFHVCCRLLIFFFKIISLEKYMKDHTLYFRKLGKMSENLPSAAVVIGAFVISRIRLVSFRASRFMNTELIPLAQ